MGIIQKNTEMHLSRHPALITNNLDEVQNHIARLFRPHTLSLKRGFRNFDFTHNRIALGGCSFSSLRYGCETTIDAGPSERNHLLMFTIKGQGEITQKKLTVETKPGSIVVFNRLSDLHTHFSEDYEQLVVDIEEEKLNCFLRNNFNLEIIEPLQFDSNCHSITATGASLWRLVANICEDMNTEHPGYNNPCVNNQIEQALIALTLNQLANNYSPFLNRNEQSAKPYYVRRAEEYIRTNIAKPISINDLAAITGTCSRSLQTGFKKTLNTTPMMYLRNCRLELARKHLMDKANHEKSITDIALDCGFTHLSYFSRYYLERFGELPSATKKRSFLSHCNKKIYR